MSFICRTGVHEAYGGYVPTAKLRNVPTGALRLYYDCGVINRPADCGAAATHARDVRDAGLWGLPQVHQTGVLLPSTFRDSMARFLMTQPHFPWIEIGNEPRKNPDPGQPGWPTYFEMFAESAPMVRSAGSKAIVAAGFAHETEREDLLMEFPHFDLADGVSIHPYGHTPEDVVAMIGTLRHLTPPRLPLFVTEFGWGTVPGSQMTPERQGQYIQRTLDLLMKGDPPLAQQWNLRLLCVFCYKDGPERKPNDYYAHTGTIFESGVRKPSYFVLLNTPKMTRYS